MLLSLVNRHVLRIRKKSLNSVNGINSWLSQPLRGSFLECLARLIPGSITRAWRGFAPCPGRSLGFKQSAKSVRNSPAASWLNYPTSAPAYPFSFLYFVCVLFIYSFPPTPPLISFCNSVQTTIHMYIPPPPLLPAPMPLNPPLELSSQKLPLDSLTSVPILFVYAIESVQMEWMRMQLFGALFKQTRQHDFPWSGLDTV